MALLSSLEVFTLRANIHVDNVAALYNYKVTIKHVCGFTVAVLNHFIFSVTSLYLGTSSFQL